MGQVLVSLRRAFSGLVSALRSALSNAGLFLFDTILALYNLITPNRRKGNVVHKGCPGFGGKWPEYVAPQKGDSRGSCPALNALANHGAHPLPPPSHATAPADA